MAIEGLDRPVGVWRAVRSLGDYKLSEALWPEVTLSVVIGGAGSVFVVRGTDVAARVDAMSEVIALAAAFLAVTFTALAIVVSLPSTSYLKTLGETEGGGMRKFLDPFLVAVGTQVALVLFAVGYRFVADVVPPPLEKGAFYLMGFLFVFGLLDIAGLARQLVRHGVLRAVDAAVTEAEQGQKTAAVRRLPDGRR
jgi:hypothetical protein